MSTATDDRRAIFSEVDEDGHVLFPAEAAEVDDGPHASRTNPSTGSGCPADTPRNTLERA